MSSRAGNLSLETEAATLVHRLNGRWHGDGGMCCCPAHEDRTPSLSVRVGNTTLLFKCFAGCSGVDIVRAIRRLNLAVPVSPASLSAGHRPSRRNLAAVAASMKETWPILGTRARWRLGELTVQWDAVKPNGFGWS